MQLNLIIQLILRQISRTAQTNSSIIQSWHVVGRCGLERSPVATCSWGHGARSHSLHVLWCIYYADFTEERIFLHRSCDFTVLEIVRSQQYRKTCSYTHHEGVGESRGITPLILKLGVSCRWMFSLTSMPLYLQWKSSQAGWASEWSERFWEELRL